ncbi:MAG: 50S ribosomal protein L11 [Candidatus Heimdallarchaeota archaeon]|nr:50S ribosomal protein L11 [Candidatus Heimdallarchaeota archaeon]
MSSDTIETISLLVDAGEAKPSGAIAPALGPFGLNLGAVVADINKNTSTFKGMKVPVKVIVNTTAKTYEIEVGLPPTSALVLNEIGLSKGGGLAGTEVVGNLTIEQVLNVANAKRADLLAASLKAAAKEVLGTTVSMGITTEGVDPREIQKRIDAGEFDSQIKKAEIA